jgi:hypothetical protein
MAVESFSFLDTLIGIALGGMVVGLIKFPQELARGYGRELGKNLATRQDVDNILNHLQASTLVTEGIRTQFASGEWNRQKLMEQKRDVYKSCLEALAESIAGHLYVGAFELMRSIPVPLDPEKLSEARRRSTAASGNLRSQAALASIFLNSEASEAMREASAKRPMEGMSSPAAELEWSNREGEILEAARLRVVAAARAELGVTSV